MTSLELLKEIEAWLSFNTEPSKEETTKLRKSIEEHVNEQLRLGAVVRSVCKHETILGGDGYFYCADCGAGRL
jgi:hypothetical protein